jgi:hypothetical protein
MSIKDLSFIRKVLFADAAISGATGVMMTLGAGLLTGFLGLSENLLFWAGLGLLPFAALVAAVGNKQHPAKGGVWTIVLINIAWVIASVAILVFGLVSPTIFGTVFVVAQAIVVGVLAELQIIGVRRDPALA